MNIGWKTCLFGCAVGLFARPTAAIMLGTAMVSCADDDDAEGSGGEGTTVAGATAQGTSSTGPDPFAQCSKGQLEADFVQDSPWAGPGVDPDTGEIEAGSYRVATTYLALEPDKTDRVFELSGPVIETLSMSQGLVAVTTGQSESCAALRTFTVWRTEEDMFAFVASSAHATAMGETSELSRGTSNTISWDGDETTITWEEAASRLGTEVGGDR